MSKYKDLTKEKLLEIVEQQDKELQDPKKYGLFWDKEKVVENVVADCENNLPVLKRIGSKEIKTDDSEDNILIEGDNYHALNVLNYTHRNKIDVIYIDPPYNTGKAKEWKYNDKYVDENDGYKHSKWINFMEKRIQLAKKLLKNEGVIFISIDNHESAQLKMICDQVFGENNFVAEITRESIKGGSKSAHIRECHDYVLIYAKDKNQLTFSGYSQEGKTLDLEDENGKYAKGRELNKWGAGSRREDSPSMWFPIKGPNGEEVYPIRNDGSEGRWRLGKKKMSQRVAENNVIFEQRDDASYIVYEKIRDDSDKIKQFTTIFKDNYLNAKGGEALKKIFGTSMSIFDYAKPVELIFDLLIMADMDDDAIVLDFFAGSGTTAQAILELNKYDGGNRKFILCTNNEGDICEKITYPRINKIVNGYNFIGKDNTILLEKKLTFSQLKNIDSILVEINQIINENKGQYYQIKKDFKKNTIKITGIKNIKGYKDGIGGNLKYFKTDFVKNTNNRDQLKINLTKKCTEILCVKENIFNLKKDQENYKIFTSNDSNRHLCIYYNFIDKDFDNFVKDISKLNGTKAVYIFALNNKIDKKEFKGIPDVSFEAIPYKILEVYEQLVKISKK